jgi:chemotaxis protein CheX
MPAPLSIKPLSIKIEPKEVAQVVESVFGSMMSLEVTGSATPWIAGAGRLVSAVYLAGDWNGAVLLECDQSQACRFAGRFLSINTPEEVDDDVFDVLGELANMIGGNLKSLWGAGIRLSMPSVVDGTNYNLRIVGAKVLEQLTFECDEGLFWITVLTTRA